MRTQLRVLMVEHSLDDADLLIGEIARGGYRVEHARVETAAEMRSEFARKPWNLVISDYHLPQFSGLDALQLAKMHDPDLPFIIASGTMSEVFAVEAMRAGANDYVMKTNPSRLVPAIERELRESVIRRSVRKLRVETEQAESQLRAMVANIPGVVFQLTCDPQGSYGISYISDASNRLLEVTPQVLQADVGHLFNIMLDGGNVSLQDRIAESALTLQPVSWEGRISAASDGRVKWIEVRMRPRLLKDDRIQWDGIIENVSDRKAAELELVRSRQQLSELSSHLQKAKEIERTRIAREVHDEIGGNLTAMKIEILSLASRLGEASPDLRNKLDSVETLIDHTMEITARIAHDLRPPLLDLGLSAAVEWEAGQFSHRMNMPCTVRCSGEDSHLDAELATALFSIFRETLTNVTKHASATRVAVLLDIEQDEVCLMVTDDGRGMTEDDLHKAASFGLRGMRERARHLGGEVTVEGKPGAGTVVRVMLPIESARQLQLDIDTPENP